MVDNPGLTSNVGTGEKLPKPPYKSNFLKKTKLLSFTLPCEIIKISSRWTLSLKLITFGREITKTSKNYFFDIENCVSLKTIDFSGN